MRRSGLENFFLTYANNFYVNKLSPFYTLKIAATNKIHKQDSLGFKTLQVFAVGFPLEKINSYSIWSDSFWKLNLVTLSQGILAFYKTKSLSKVVFMRYDILESVTFCYWKKIYWIWSSMAHSQKDDTVIGSADYFDFQILELKEN